MKKLKRPLIILAIIAVAVLIAIFADMGLAALQGALHPSDYSEYIEKYSSLYGIPSYIVYAVIDVESNFDPLASSGEAYGLMQMTPKTFHWLTSNEHLGENLYSSQLFDPEVSIRYGCYYLRYLYNRFKVWDTVLAAYNGGEGNVAKWLQDANYSDGKGNLTDIPFPETKSYVKKVTSAIEYYKTNTKK